MRNAIITSVEANGIKVISEIAHNTLKNKTEVQNSPNYEKLKKYSKTLRSLASRSLSISKKRALLLKSGKLLKILLESLFRSVIGEIINQGV
jgi:hypothetical protein